MTIVTLITTGKAEEAAFADFLSSHFEGCDVTFRSEFTDGFTSSRLLKHFDTAPTNAAKLAARLVAAVDPGARIKGQEKSDFAIAIEDIELFNRDQPERITEVFADAVNAHIKKTWPSQHRQKKAMERVRKKASFHLLSPMLESYFFTDPQSIESMKLDSAVVKQDSDDAEKFRTENVDYLKSVEHLDPLSVGGTAREWFGSHPKHFINYYFDSSEEYDPKRNLYREVMHGAPALRKLRTEMVFAVNEHCSFLRSLINDLSLALGVEQVTGVENDVTKFGSGKTLRNI